MEARKRVGISTVCALQQRSYQNEKPYLPQLEETQGHQRRPGEAKNKQMGKKSFLFFKEGMIVALCMLKYTGMTKSM